MTENDPAIKFLCRLQMQWQDRIGGTLGPQLPDSLLRETILVLRDVVLGDGSILGDVRAGVNEKGLTALPVMPLTMSMEILAEAATLLMPDKVLIGMKDIRAYRWIALEQNSFSLQITARRKPGTDEVEASIQNPEETKASSENPVLEGTLVFASRSPMRPRTRPTQSCATSTRLH